MSDTKLYMLFLWVKYALFISHAHLKYKVYRQKVIEAELVVDFLALRSTMPDDRGINVVIEYLCTMWPVLYVCICVYAGMYICVDVYVCVLVLSFVIVGCPLHVSDENERSE